jgi:hypothetical protein
VDTHNPGSLSLLLISCVLSTGVSLPVLAAGDGVIVIQRQVQPYAIGRTRGTDPNPSTVNANQSAVISRAANSELSDNDFSSVSSGVSITRNIMPNGDLAGLTNTNSIGLGAGSAAGHGGSGIAGTVNGAVSRGLAPVSNIGGMIGGAMK